MGRPTERVRDRAGSQDHEGDRHDPSGVRGTDDLASLDPVAGLHRMLDLCRVDQKAGKAQRIAHAGLEDKLPVTDRIAEIACPEKSIRRDRPGGRLGVVQIACHQGGRRDLELARFAVRQQHAGLRVARTHARRCMDERAAGEIAYAGVAIVIPARLRGREGLQLARSVQPGQFQAVLFCPLKKISRGRRKVCEAEQPAGSEVFPRTR